MKLDLVHDIQTSYRKVLNSMSRPGRIENIALQSKKADIEIDFYPTTLVIMLMLLDAEVSYKIVSAREEEITNLINQLTYAKFKSTEDADFIFVLQDATTKQIEEAFRNAKIGNLIDPHQSTTLIVETNGLSNDHEMILKGPGIAEIEYAKIQVDANWIHEREMKNQEYPLGIDVIFIDRDSNMMCIPRTTQILKQVVK